MKRAKQVSFAPRRVDIKYKDLGYEPRWFVLQILPQLQATAGYNLSNQNFQSFFPKIHIRRGSKWSIEPLFRGYGFVLFNPAADAWNSINGTRGVIGLLPRFSLYPTPVPEGFVEKLKEGDPIKEDDFLDAFESFFPGVTEIVVRDSHRWLGGRVGLVVGIRSRLLQVSFTAEFGTPVWLDRGDVMVKT